MTPTRFAPNPFYYRGPIQRRELIVQSNSFVRRVLKRLQRGQSVSVVGKEKTGKTSFLYYTATPEVAVRHGFAPQMHLFFYVACKPMGKLSKEECFVQIKETIEQTVSAWETRSVSGIQNLSISDAYRWIEEALWLLVQQGIQPIIQLDDLECLATTNREGYTFLGNLRALAEIHSVAYLTASQVSLVELQRDPKIAGSPFFNIFREYELQFFAPHHSHKFLMERLASVGADFPENIREFILSQEDDPYRFQLAAACGYDVWCENEGCLQEEHLEEVKKRFERE
jgi:hypothetical protein